VVVLADRGAFSFQLKQRKVCFSQVPLPQEKPPSMQQTFYDLLLTNIKNADGSCPAFAMRDRRKSAFKMRLLATSTLQLSQRS
jgi:hypothetical protein